MIFKKGLLICVLIIITVLFGLGLSLRKVSASCNPAQCGEPDVDDCSSSQHCLAKCCVDNSSSGGSGGSCVRSCSGTNCNKSPAGCSPITSSSCNDDCDCGASGCGPAPTATPAPTCTVTLSPDPASISAGTTQVYTASQTHTGTITQVNFTSGNSTIASVSPASDATSAYTTTATGQTAGSTTIRAGIIMAGAERCADSAAITVTPPSPWWQVQDSDVLTWGDIISLIPPLAGQNFILPGAGGFPGIAVYGGTTTDFEAGGGTGTVSETGWLVNSVSSTQKVFSYDYFRSLIPADVTFNTISSPSITAADLTSGVQSQGYYWNIYDGESANQDLTITGNSDFGSDKVVLLVKGANLNITGDINVTDWVGTFIVIVGKDADGNKGSINVDPTVGASPIDLEGIYFADSQFNTGSAGVDADTQLYMRGAVAAYDGVILERDLVDDSATPAEFFEYGIDQTLLFPQALSVQKIKWKEVAP